MYRGKHMRCLNYWHIFTVLCGKLTRYSLLLSCNYCTNSRLFLQFDILLMFFRTVRRLNVLLSLMLHKCQCFQPGQRSTMLGFLENILCGESRATKIQLKNPLDFFSFSRLTPDCGRMPEEFFNGITIPGWGDFKAIEEYCVCDGEEGQEGAGCEHCDDKFKTSNFVRAQIPTTPTPTHTHTHAPPPPPPPSPAMMPAAAVLGETGYNWVKACTW